MELHNITIMDYRVGLGYDIHPLARGRKLILGGVRIPYSLGLKGHSDADVLLHAICDALLGAMSKDDIGRHFPNTDRRFKGISSLKLLHKVYEISRKEKYRLINIDTVLILERPKITSFRNKMISNICETLNIEKSQINIKATTQEGIGDIGKGKAAAAYAIALLGRGKT
ncbi:unnamed protein product [marine sediment metagenome]|uniref:2-C-methyl-D-erythritol 2,4-cyclodiphosphate synthase n=1 Tax=marine sediment metagenome TaxID=412755 RepID=X0TPQ8_9ZZZZ